MTREFCKNEMKKYFYDDVDVEEFCKRQGREAKILLEEIKIEKEFCKQKEEFFQEDADRWLRLIKSYDDEIKNLVEKREFARQRWIVEKWNSRKKK